MSRRDIKYAVFIGASFIVRLRHVNTLPIIFIQALRTGNNTLLSAMINDSCFIEMILNPEVFGHLYSNCRYNPYSHPELIPQFAIKYNNRKIFDWWCTAIAPARSYSERFGKFRGHDDLVRLLIRYKRQWVNTDWYLQWPNDPTIYLYEMLYRQATLNDVVWCEPYLCNINGDDILGLAEIATITGNFEIRDWLPDIKTTWDSPMILV